MSERLTTKQPSLPTTLSDSGPSQLLPFLYVGCQEDVISTKTMQDNHITHVINVSTTGDKPSFLNENDSEHFLRIPINDCLHAQLLPYFDRAYAFIEKARVNNGRVLIHCLAGISRSPALAIAYIMRYLHLSADDAYRYVKQRRSQISPNFNFLGQLSEYERNLSITSKSTTIPTSTVKCIAIESPLNDRRRFIQVECSSNTNNRTNVLSRPTSLFSSSSSNTRSLPIESSQSQFSLRPKLSRPNNISLKHPSSKLINSSYDQLNDNQQIETIPKSTDTLSSIESMDLINTYFQGPISSKSLDEWQSAESMNSTNETTKTDQVLNSSVELLVL